nr:uncharacterized Rho GTPase-activating protein At5g61530 [Ipomoea batatas]
MVQVAKKTAQKSKTLMTDIERWQKGVASTDVFGVPIEITVHRQQSTRPIPSILVKCADYLVLSGLNSRGLFKSEGDKKTIQNLVSLYNEDPSATLPEGINPLDVAALIKCYLASLPEPLTTFQLYNEIRDARSSIPTMRNILKKLPTVNYMTLELITALLLRVSQKSPVNEKTRLDSDSNYSPWDMLADEDENVDASSPIPLDDGLPVDFGVIEVVQCLIEHHNAIFTDANETVWRMEFEECAISTLESFRVSACMSL